jgi:hypothetical protein
MPFPKNANLAIGEILQLQDSAIFLRKDGIIQIQTKDYVSIKENESIGLVQILKAISGEKKFPALILYGEFNSFSKEAMDIFASHDVTTADALVATDNLASAILSNLFFKTTKQNRPMQLFHSEEEAVAWLKSLP